MAAATPLATSRLMAFLASGRSMVTIKTPDSLSTTTARGCSAKPSARGCSPTTSHPSFVRNRRRSRFRRFCNGRHVAADLLDGDVSGRYLCTGLAVLRALGWVLATGRPRSGFLLHEEVNPGSSRRQINLGQLLELFNLLEGFDLKSLGHNTAKYIHLLAEAGKLTVADRIAFGADPAVANVPVTGLLSKAYAAEHQGGAEGVLQVVKGARHARPGCVDLEVP